MKRLSLFFLLLSGLFLNTPKAKAVPTFCCLSASMEYCVIVMYPGTGGDGPSHKFRGIKVDCPSIP